jgi:hypothetical protein
LPFGASTAPNSSRDDIVRQDQDDVISGELHMPHSFLELYENQWSLVRETPSSQKFRVTTSDGSELGVDVHYTMPKVLSASIAFPGSVRGLPRYVLDSVMDELAQIVLKTGIDYAVIDYTLTNGNSMTEGNYSIDKKARVIRRL